MPFPPQWVIRVPMPSRTCRLRSSTSASPPTMIESVPLSAPVIPPLTGPSSMWTPFSASFDATSLVTAGDIVLMSMTTEPASAPSATPFAPRMTSSTSGESFTIVIVNSLPSAASLADPAGFAPAATTSSIFDAVRFQHVTSKPFLTKFMHIGFPMRPRPMNPTLVIPKLLLETARLGVYYTFPLVPRGRVQILPQHNPL